MTHPRTLLVPIDFSDGSRRATDFAMRLAKQNGAELVLLSVFDLPVYATPLGLDPAGAPLGPPQQFVDTVRDGLQRDLDRLVAELDGDVHVRGQLAEGVAAPTITKVADELGADMIVMGTHGRTGLSHLMLGSVAERVVRTAGRPVMTVPLSREA